MKLARVSYANYLKDVVGVHADIVKLFQAMPHPLFGVGIDAVSAQDAWGFDMPGFAGLKLDDRPGQGHEPRLHSQRGSRKIFLSLSRRQCQHRASAGAQIDSRCDSGEFVVRCSFGESELCQARSRAALRCASG